MNFFNHTGKNKNMLLIVVVAMCLYGALRINSDDVSSSKIITISEFMKANEASNVISVEMGPEFLWGEMRDGGKFVTSYPIYYSGKMIDEMLKKNVNITFLSGGDKGFFAKLFGILGNILSWIPLLFLAWIWFTAFRGMGGGGKGGGNGGGGMFGGGGAFGFGRNKSKMIQPGDLKVKFIDVAGIDEAKEELQEIVDFLKDPQKYQKVGGKIPKGCLLSGPPGTGKTLLAKAIAAEAGVPFFSSSGSDFVEMFVGVGASRVRDMFAQAKRNAPCIVFIDEIDAVGRHRGVGVGGGNDEREQTLNQLLVEMDGFEENIGIVVIAATNRADVLDGALTRPGRFDRQIVIGLPDINGREQILKVHGKNIKLAPSVNLKTIARSTSGFSGADLANLMNESALLAARRSKNIVTTEDVEEARDKIMMGMERKTLVMTKEEKELTAYHEGGHALVAANLPASDPIHKATIIPRGRALGLVMRLPEVDRFSMTRDKMHADLAVAMAGRVAEEIIFGNDKVTSGASSDIEMATKMARAMVTQWGLSDRLGYINYSSDHMYNKSAYQCSEATAQMIDEEVRKIVHDGYVTAKKIINEHIENLHKIAGALLKFETLTGKEIGDILNGLEVVREIEVRVKSDSFLGTKGVNDHAQ